MENSFLVYYTKLCSATSFSPGENYSITHTQLAGKTHKIHVCRLISKKSKLHSPVQIRCNQVCISTLLLGQDYLPLTYCDLSYWKNIRFQGVININSHGPSGASVDHTFFHSVAFFTERNQNLTKAKRSKAKCAPISCTSSWQITNLPNVGWFVLFPLLSRASPQCGQGCLTFPN